MDAIYLDYAAATPMDERVIRAMQPYLRDQFYNPSALYQPALQVRTALQAARNTVAQWIGSRPNEIIFTAGGTEANNLAIQGVMRKWPDGNVIVTAVEHEAVLAPAGLFERHVAAVDDRATVNLADITAKIDSHTVLVSVMYANNEVGTIQPLRHVSEAVLAERHRRQAAMDSRPIYLHSDACQAGNYLDVHAARLGVDLLTINGGKLYGPKQSGALFVKAGTVLQPLILGGGQERGLRSGTENVAAAVGLATALDIAQQERAAETARLQTLQQLFFDGIRTTLPQALINGSPKKRLPNNVHVTIPGQDNERLLLQLEARGILAAAGSACSASDDTSSHVLRAMGVDDAAARASLRLSMGRASTASHVERTITALNAIVNSATQ